MLSLVNQGNRQPNRNQVIWLNKCGANHIMFKFLQQEKNKKNI